VLTLTSGIRAGTGTGITIGSVTKIGSGTLRLTATTSTSNTNFSGLSILGGVVEIAQNGTSNPDFNAIGAAGGGLRLDGGTLRMTYTALNSTGRNVTLGTGGGTLDAGAGTSVRFTGAFSGTGGSLTKAGPGTVRLEGASNYTGNTNILAGTLSVDDGSSLGSNANPTTITIAGGASLAYSSATLNAAFHANRTIALDAGAGIYVGPYAGAGTAGANPVATHTPMRTLGALVDAAGGTGGLTKTGPGFLILTGTTSTSYSGPTTVAEGTLLFNRGKTGTGGITVAAAGTVGGTALVNVGANALSVLGTLSPGDSSGIAGTSPIGSLGVTGNVGFTNGTLAVDFNGAGSTPAAQADLLTVSDNLDLSSAVADFQGLSSLSSVPEGTAYVFARYGSLTPGSTFASFATPLQSTWMVDYNYQGLNQIALVVPEPAVVGLLASAGLGPLIRRRRR
jgi:autotransporter-associated beta strand protein